MSLDQAWRPGPDDIVIGKDVLELLSTSMYVDPMTIYREYVQNAADPLMMRVRRICCHLPNRGW